MGMRSGLLSVPHTLAPVAGDVAAPWAGAGNGGLAAAVRYTQLGLYTLPVDRGVEGVEAGDGGRGGEGGVIKAGQRRLG